MPGRWSVAEAGARTPADRRLSPWQCGRPPADARRTKAVVRLDARGGVLALLRRTRRGSAVTVRETAGLSAEAQPIDVDAGLAQLVRSGSVDDE
jgi:hypothetical protein